MGSNPALYQNVSMLPNWVNGMGDAASRNGVGVLYCCAPPSIHMAGVAVPAAFGVRASPDYVWQGGGKVIKLPTVQWAIGPDNAFHWNGLGLLPYKDTFFSNATMTQQSGRWSKDPNQWPPFAGYRELNALTHALMALLSMAQVTFGDAVGQSNRTLLMYLVREDGMLLKADRPATAIDDQFQSMMFGNWPGESKASELVFIACDGRQSQQWTYDRTVGSLTLNGACMDIAGCNKEEGATVHLYNGGDDFKCGAPGQPGSRDANPNPNPNPNPRSTRLSRR